VTQRCTNKINADVQQPAAAQQRKMLSRHCCSNKGDAPMVELIATLQEEEQKENKDQRCQIHAQKILCAD